MKIKIIDLEPYCEKAVNEARQARLDARIERRNRPREIGGYPWRNISTDEALDHIRKEGLR